MDNEFGRYADMIYSLVISPMNIMIWQILNG
jgi:hypothetical protein